MLLEAWNFHMFREDWKWFMTSYLLFNWSRTIWIVRPISVQSKCKSWRVCGLYSTHLVFRCKRLGSLSSPSCWFCALVLAWWNLPTKTGYVKKKGAVSEVQRTKICVSTGIFFRFWRHFICLFFWRGHVKNHFAGSTRFLYPWFWRRWAGSWWTCWP